MSYNKDIKGFSNSLNPPPLPTSPPPKIPNSTTKNTLINENNSKNDKFNLKLDTFEPCNYNNEYSTKTPEIITINSSPPKQSQILSKPKSPTPSMTPSLTPSLTPHRKKNKKLASSRNSFLHASPLYDEVSNKLAISNTPNTSPVSISTRRSFSSGKSTDSKRQSIHSAVSIEKNDNTIILCNNDLNSTPDTIVLSKVSTRNMPNESEPQNVNFENEIEDWNEGMFDHFSFENMIANRNLPLESTISNRSVSGTAIPAHESKSNSTSRSVSVPSSRKTSSTIIPPMLNPSCKNSKPLNIQPVSTNNSIMHQSQSSESSIDSPSLSNMKISKDNSPININRDDNIYMNKSLSKNKSINTHRRSSSKGSLHEKSTKSFFKFFGSKKYNSDNSPKLSHSRSHSRSSDGSLNNESMKQHKKSWSNESSNNSPVSLISNKSSKFSMRSPRVDENRRFSSIHDNESTQTLNKNKSTENLYSTSVSGSMPTLSNLKIGASTTSTIKPSSAKNELGSNTGSIKSIGSSKSMNVSLLSSNLFSEQAPSMSYPVYNHSLKSESTMSRKSAPSTSVATPTTVSTPISTVIPSSVSTMSTSATTNTSNSSVRSNSTHKVRSLVALGSKSNSLNKKGSTHSTFINSHEWNGWDGHSGSFEKIGPVGKKPSPYGITIPVKTKSNLHSVKTDPNITQNTNKPTSPVINRKQSSVSILSKTSVSLDKKANDGFFAQPTITRLSSSSTPTLIHTDSDTYVSDRKSPATSGILALYGDESATSTKSSLNSHSKADCFGINPKYIPKSVHSSKVSKKIFVTLNFVDYKLFDFNNVSKISKFFMALSNTFKFKNTDNIQIFLSDFGGSKELLGQKLEMSVLQNIWDGLLILSTSKQLVFYITTNDDKLTSSPNKPSSMSLAISHDKLEETSLYTTYTTSSNNSDLSYDKYLPTPQHLISVGKDSNIDYWNVKDSIERKPSITRAPSVTHSSIHGDAAAFPLTLSRKTSKLSISSGKSSATNTSNDNSKRISSLNTPSNLIAKRNPPPPPPPTSSPTQSISKSGSDQLEKPPNPAFQRSRSKSNMPKAKNDKINSNSIRSLQRTNTTVSCFSTHSSSSAVDPFLESQVSFVNLDSEDSISSCEENDSDEHESDSEFGLFAKKPKVKSDSFKNSKQKNDSKIPSDDDDDDDDDDYGLFQKKPAKGSKIKNNLKSSQSNELITNISKTKICDSNDGSSDENSITQSLENMKHDDLTITNNTDIKNVDMNISDSLDIRPPADVLYNNLEVFFQNADLDSLIIDDATSAKGIGRMKSIRAIAQEAHRRNSYRLPAFAKKSGLNENNNSQLLYNRRINAPLANSSLLRRTSTKMWGQKTVEVKLDSKNKTQDLKVRKRDKNGEFVEFAWIKGEMIGKGNFARVYVAMNITTGELIAVKQIHIKDEKTSAFTEEVDLLKDLDHINIVQYLGFEIKDKIYSIFLEYVPGGSIGHLLRKYGRFEEPLIRHLVKQILEGLNYIHLKGILHRDLKADNVLLEIDGMLKISDFGISKRAKDIYTSKSKMEFQGTISWMAPEIIKDVDGNGYNAKVDIWALGCVVIEMFSAERPWNQYEEARLIYKLTEERVIPPIPKSIRKDMSSSSKNFLKRCLEIDATRRPTAQTLLSDSFCIVDPEFEFKNTSLAKKMHNIEEQEKESLNKRMKSMVRKL